MVVPHLVAGLQPNLSPGRLGPRLAAVRGHVDSMLVRTTDTVLGCPPAVRGNAESMPVGAFDT